VDQEAVRTVYLKGSYELLRRRVEERSHPYMNKDLLRSQVSIMEEPKEGLTVDISSKPEIAVETIVKWLGLSQ
jgi:gluconokinase